MIIKTAFTDMVGIEYPIAAFSRSPKVVAEVSRVGGLGVLGASAYRPDELDRQLSWIEGQTSGKPIGIDILIPANEAEGEHSQNSYRQIPLAHREFVADMLNSFGIDASRLGTMTAGASTAEAVSARGVEKLLDVVFRHRISLVANALGKTPPSLIERAHNLGVPVAALVGNSDHARNQMEAGVDLIVAQGTEAGGHTGAVTSIVLTPEVVAVAGDVPVLTAGGIATGDQLAAAFALGAAGAWCGSVWLSTFEDITPARIKRKLLDARSDDTVRSRSRTGKPARQLRSPWHEAWESTDAPPPLSMPLQILLAKEAWAIIDEAADAGHEGALELESFFIGQVVGGFSQLRYAADVVEHIMAQCHERLRALGGNTSRSR